jgi:starch-binding outer membrane protein, SusD/RagB family
MYNVLLGLALIVLLGSCEKKLTDLQPIDQIPAQNAIQNMADVQSAVNGVYGTYLGRRASYLCSFFTDEVRLGTGTEYRNVGNILFNWQFVNDSQDWRDGENGGGWTNLYTVIDRANRILELMIPVQPANPTEAALKNQLRGEMLAMRAFCHLELLRWFAQTPQYTPTGLGIVVMSEFSKAPTAFKPARVAQSEAVDLIQRDLNEALTLIPTSFVNVGKITRNAVIGGLVRLAVHTRNWNSVVTNANTLLASQPLSTGAAYTNIFTTRVLPENQSSEVIWKLNVTAANLGAAVGSLWQDVGSGAVQASAATKLTELFDPVNDIRYSTFFHTTPTRLLIKKYGVVITSPANGENFQYDIKMMRSSEILLARAEAQAELNNLTAANNDLAALRAARIDGYIHTTITNKDALIGAIMEERYKELCYEGQRYFDLKRRATPITRSLVDVVGVTAITELAVNNFRFILPIPQQEVFANPNMQQNPGY